MELKGLMEGLAAEAAAVGIAPDEGGAYHLGIDGMRISFLEAGGRLAVWADVGEPPPEGRERLFRTLLESTFMGEGAGGAAFAIDAKSGRVILQRIEASGVLDLIGFKAMLEKFVNVLEKWRKLVADFRDIAPSIDAAAEDEAAVERQLGLGEVGFLRV